MGHSDEEEDFLSADEGDEEIQSAKPRNIVQASDKVRSNFQDENKSPTTISTQNEESIINQPTAVFSSSMNDEGNKTLGITSTSIESSSKQDLSQSYNDDVDEDAIAERIRERNLRIARKFSAEIAKTVKASAPIPMITDQNRLDADTSDLDTSISSADSKSVGSLPPAPPPTPALSSSLNNSEASSNLSSQETSKYSWRIPTSHIETDPKLTQALPSQSDKTTQAPKFALDRLSERLSHTDNNKNLFERVAEDIKKVSLNRNNLPSDQPSGGIPIISDLGSSLGTLGWNSASKFFSSATQVTSRVGTSVIDSVVNVTQQATRSKEQTSTPELNQKSANTTESLQTDQNQTVSSSIQSPDAIVGMTLDAMESLGKRAFSVMTERDESGSIQIKGLGRPWEHLMNITKQSTQPDSSPEYEKDNSHVLEQADESEVLNTYETSKAIDTTSGGSNCLPSGLKNRKRRVS